MCVCVCVCARKKVFIKVDRLGIYVCICMGVRRMKGECKGSRAGRSGDGDRSGGMVVWLRHARIDRTCCTHTHPEPRAHSLTLFAFIFHR